MQKDTSEILKELGLSQDFQAFYNENKDYMVSGNLAELLEALLKTKGLRKSQVIRNAELSEVYGYQIFSGIRVPERKKLICLALSMKLNIDEVQQLLRCAGYSPLYAKITFDSVVLYGFYKGLSVIEVNDLLYRYNLETL